MAEEYDRPLITFFRDAPVQDRDHLPDFRFLPVRRAAQWSPAMHKAFRRAVRQQEVILGLIEESDDDALREMVPPIDIRLKLSNNIEDAATSIRRWLLANHGALDDAFSLSQWIAFVEEKGILVLSVSGVEVSEMRGFSIGGAVCPVIGLNNKDSLNARTFSLLHELVHICLASSALCDVGNIGGRKTHESSKIEWFCNAVAAATLMPRSQLLQDEVVFSATPNKPWTKRELTHLSNRFKVSSEAILLRLVSIGLSTPEYYRT
jgi:Zn-dependent peptidase ImmA (M78 family)